MRDGSPRSHFRWVVCGLLFAGTTINYVDRQILALLKPMLDRDLHWTNQEYGAATSAFFITYAGCYVIFGRIIDHVGPKRGYSIAAFCWSLAAMANGWAGSVRSFFLARFALGFGEAGNYPAAIKSIGVWFPRQERAFAASIFNSGSTVSAVIAPAIVPWIADRYGWRMCFFALGAAGLLWLWLWLAFFHEPDRSPFATAAELEYIRSDREAGACAGRPVPWTELLRNRQALAIIVAKFLTDPIYWFFLFWLPDFYHKTRGLDLRNSWYYLVAIYALATVFSYAGGWFSGALLKRGWSLTRARKTALLVLAGFVLPVWFAPDASLWVAIVFIGLACGAHQAWNCTLYALMADLFPQRAIATLSGTAGTMGAAAGVGFPIFAGWLLDTYQSSGRGQTAAYSILFAICSTAYVVAFAFNHLLAPRYERVEFANQPG